MLKRQEYKLQNKVVLGRAQFMPPFKASSALQNEARVVHVVTGESSLYYPNGKLQFKSGDSFIMKCENFVNTWMSTEINQPAEVLILQFYPEVLEYVYNDQLPGFLSNDGTKKNNAVEKIEAGVLVKNYMDNLRYYMEMPALIDDELLKIKIRELILILINSDSTGAIRAILSDLFNTNEYEFKEVIHSHLYEDLKLDDLAFLTGMSLSTFKRKFKSVFQTSPNQYIKQRRLSKAEDLLKKPNLRISEIAFSCGFNDLSYFSKSFTAAFDISPSEYRNRLMT